MEFKEFMKKINDSDMLITPDATKVLKDRDDLDLVAKEILSGSDFVITPDVVENVLRKEEEKKIPVPVEIKRSPEFKPAAKEYSSQILINKESDISGKSKCTGSVGDFVDYFRDRFKETEKMLKARVHKNGIISTKAMEGYGNGSRVRIIGIVTSKRKTKKGHFFIELEDEHGIAKVLALESKNEPGRSCFEKANSLLLDEIVAVDGKISDPFFIAEDIIWPDLPVKEQKLSEEDLCIACLSDIHVGSRHFMEKNFRSMINWINGGGDDRTQRELAGKIKYLFVAGDLVDGIGIYPDQDRELTIKDVYEQYSVFAEFLNQIPDYIEIVVGPGNHDAIRRAEPQPRLPDELSEQLKGRDNVHLVGSPTTIQVEGLKTLMYHGTSLDSIIAAIPGCSYQTPEVPMLELLKRRNLSPIYGENPIVPEKKDYMVITEPPDLVHMGHVHKNGYMLYRGVSIINSGTWQARTDFQIKQGHVPSPCLMPIYGMRNGKTKSVSFETETR